MTSLQSPGYSEFLAKLSSVNFAGIAGLLQGKGWERKRINRAIAGYRRFLLLLAQHPNQVLVPTREIDEAHHAHLEMESEFVTDCQRLFGSPLVHEPDFGRNEAERTAWLAAFETTQAMFASTFGLGSIDASGPAHCFATVAA